MADRQNVTDKHTHMKQLATFGEDAKMLKGPSTFIWSSCFAWLLMTPVYAQSSAFVPCSGIELKQVGDEFEDPNWSYIPNNPKSTEDIDDKQHLPIGKSKNGRCD